MSNRLILTLRLIAADIQQRCVYERKTPSVFGKVKLMFHPGVATVVLFRWQRFFDEVHAYPLAGFCRWANLLLFTSRYASNAFVEGGFLVVHAVAIEIGEGAQIGARCILFGQNAIGPSPFVTSEDHRRSTAPIVKEDVRFGVGSAAYGPICIGRGCNIGMSTLVEADVEAGSTVLGVPARITANASSEAKP